MKTINLKLKVLGEDDKYLKLKMGNECFGYFDKSFIEEHQVLTAEDISDWCIKNDKEITCESGVYLVSGNKTPLSLKQLTALIKGKERTLEDVVKDLIEVMDRSGAFQIDMLKDLKEEAEQLLKDKK